MASPIPGLTAGVTIALTGWIMSRLFAEARRAPSVAADGALTLRYGAGLRVLGVVLGLVAPLGLIALAWASPPHGRGELAAVGGLFAFFLVGGGWLLLETWRAHIVVSATGVTATSLWGRVRHLPWTEVRAVRFSPSMGYITLQGDQRRVRVSVLMAGVSALWSALAQRLPPAHFAEAQAKYTAYAQRQGARAS